MFHTRTKLPVWFAAVLGLLLCLCMDDSDVEGKRIYVSLSGKDIEQCGSAEQPCRTIVRAVQKAAWNDSVYLDGSGTEQRPYDCQIKTTPSRRVYIKISITLEGHTSMVFVSCSRGLYFEESGRDGRELRVVLSNITFSKTPLTFKQCSHVEIKKCFFKDNAKKAIDFRGPPTAGNVYFIVTKTTFTNNALCVYLDFTGTVAQNTGVIVKIDNSTFQGNTRGGNPGRAGGILITNTTKIEGLMPVNVSCKDVVYNENRGPFITLEISAAITSESYNNIEFLRNEATLGKVYKKGFWGSLYVCRVKRTKASFASVHCENNNNIRCFGIASDETHVKIRDSLVARQKVADYGGALYITQADKSVTLEIRNSSFVKCSAREGGALHVEKGSGTVNLTVHNVSFMSCNASIAGSAMIVGGYTRAKQGGKGIRVLSAFLQKIKVVNCSTGDPENPMTSSSERDFGAMSFSIGERGKIIIRKSRWTGNSAPSCAAVSISTREKVDVDVTESQFVKNFSPKLCIFCATSLAPSAGRIRFEDSAITKSANNSLCLSPLFKIVLTNLVITESKDAALVIKLHSGTLARTVGPYEAETQMNNCTFIGNPVNIICILNNSQLVNFTSRDNLFLGGSSPQIEGQAMPYNVYMQIICARKTKDIKALIIFENVTFDSANPTQFDIRCKGNKTIRVKKSVFRHSTIQCITQQTSCNAHADDVQQAGAVTILFRHDIDKTKGCVSKGNHHNTHPTWSYESFAVFEDTTFENNEGLLAGAVFAANGYTIFRRCFFKNNFSLRRGGHVSLPSGTGEVEFASSTLIQTTAVSRAGRKEEGPTYFPFLYSESTGPLTIANSTLVSNVSTTDPHPVLQVNRGGYVYLHPTTQINCSVGNKLSFENNTHYIGTYTDQSCQINMTVLSYTCGLCPPGMYSLENGFAAGLRMKQEVRCLPCPYGATCLRNVAAKPNFYGHLVSNEPPALNFSSCPEEYCSPPHTEDTSVFNGCLGNRTGILCGRCRDGFTESLFSRECRKVSECGQPWFWLLGVVVLVVLSGYLVGKPHLLHSLCKHIFWWKLESPNTEVLSNTGGSSNTGASSNTGDSSNTKASQHADSGYLKIAFYFYQVADILIIDPVSEVSEHFPLLIPIVGMFTFQVRAFDHKFGCPLTSLTVVTKELFLSLGFFAVLTCVVIMCLVQLLISNISNRFKKPRLMSYLVVAMETLLLGYESLAETSLKLLQCVPIGSEWRLFFDGNVQCLQWWQYIFLIYSVTFLLPFIAVLFFGTRLLSKSKISAKEFLWACILPLPFLLRWIALFFKQANQSPVPKEFVDEEVADVLYGPFLRHSPNDKELEEQEQEQEQEEVPEILYNDSFQRRRKQPQLGPVYWESVLIGRRLLLLLIHAFIRNQMLRMTCMTTACVLITVHHVIKAPYRDHKANCLETISLISLTFLGIINLSRAAFLSTGVTPGGSSETFFVALQQFEVFLLGLAPAIFIILVFLALLSQMVRCLNLCAKRIYPKLQVDRPNLRDSGTEREPLLINSQSL